MPFLPSLAFGLAGAIWVVLDPPELPSSPGVGVIVLTAALLAAILLAGAYLLEATLPSFRHAARLLERALARLELSPPLALVLAAATAAGEELFFRGGLMQLLGLWGQAVVFGLLHPVSRKGWAYGFYGVLAGAALGYGALLTGTLWTPVLAHFVVNLHGLVGARR